MRTHTIIILGAGFGGLKTALALGRAIKKLRLAEQYEVLLIDRNHYHTYTPLLYEVAAAPQEVANHCDFKSLATYHVRESIKGLPVLFREEDITTIDLFSGVLWTARGNRLAYDYLVLAAGSETNYFGIPGLRENSYSFKTFLDAVRLRDTIASLLASEDRAPTVLVGGGGSAGVELAAELKQWQKRLAITIVEGAPSILPGFQSPIVRKAEQRLARLGVRVKCGRFITKVEPRNALLSSGETVSFDILIWNGGTRVPNFIQSLPLAHDKRGCLSVSTELECVVAPPDASIAGRIFAIGDNASVRYPDGAQVPGVARAAIIEGGIVAQNIIEDIKGKEGFLKTVRQHAFAPKRYPYILPVGGKYAIAQCGPLVISGIFAWILKGFVELNYLRSIMPLYAAFRIWLKGLKIFTQNDRLG